MLQNSCYEWKNLAQISILNVERAMVDLETERLVLVPGVFANPYQTRHISQKHDHID